MIGEAGKSDYIHEESFINQEGQQHSHTFDNHVANHMKGYFGSDVQLMLSYQTKKEEEVAQEIVVQGHFPSPETNMNIPQCFQQDKVFQGCLSYPENDMVVQF